MIYLGPLFKAVAQPIPAHPTGGGGAFCVRLGMYVSPGMKFFGGARCVLQPCSAPGAGRGIKRREG